MSRLYIRGAAACTVFSLLLAFGAAGCAPRATEISGEIADAVREGIAGGRDKFDHSVFDAILRRHVRLEKRQFDYSGLKPNRQDLNQYLDRVAAAELRALSRDELLAFFINAYNAFTIHSILTTMTPGRPDGVASIKDIPGVFDAKVHIVAGIALSLDNIEHNVLRPMFKDPRIHFAVNCASAGCPPLADSAYLGERISEQLDAAARRTLSSPYYVRAENGRLLVTPLLDWYGGDFTEPANLGAKRSLARYIEGYAGDEVRQLISSRRGNVPVEFMSYDWTLNRAR